MALLLSCTPEDTRASQACSGSGSARECKACCSARGDRNYTFHEKHTTKYCMCQFNH